MSSEKKMFKVNNLRVGKKISTSNYGILKWRCKAEVFWQTSHNLNI